MTGNKVPTEPDDVLSRSMVEQKGFQCLLNAATEEAWQTFQENALQTISVVITKNKTLLYYYI